MTTTQSEVLEAMLAHHRTLEEGVRERAAAVDAAGKQGRLGTEVAELVAYLAREVIPHALGEEHSLYQAAAALPGLSAEVTAMRAEHRDLIASSETLAGASDGAAAARTAGEIAQLFATHVQKENELILPRLAEDPTVDLAQLLVQMHRLTEAATDEAPLAEDVSAPDRDATLLGLLLNAARALADAGGADRACQLTAAAWVALRQARPELAVRVTAALHGLARKVDEPSGLLGSAVAPQGDEAELDVRALAPAKRHEVIFETYAGLAPGSGFVLVNDHDPKPLGYQFEAEHPGEFTWDYLESGPSVFRVRIGRPARPGGAPELDVRALAPAKRHKLIFETYAGLAPGGAFVLVNDHDPKPLGYQFEAEHRGEYTWEALESGPKVWRVRIGRPDAVERELPELDVRTLAHGQRHETIFSIYTNLGPGDAFILVNDHDPRPLRYQFEAQYGSEYAWDYLEAGPDVWRVRIGKQA